VAAALLRQLKKKRKKRRKKWKWEAAVIYLVAMAVATAVITKQIWKGKASFLTLVNSSFTCARFVQTFPNLVFCPVLISCDLWNFLNFSLGRSCVPSSNSNPSKRCF